MGDQIVITKNTLAVSRPLPLQGAKNVRDLGGYIGTGGVATRRGAFLRADSLGRLSEQDRQALYQYGVRCVIDLRSKQELQREPNRLKGYCDIEYENISISDGVQSSGLQGNDFPPTMADLYIGLLDSAGPSIYQVMQTALRHPRETVLFHCSAGKDRTGTVAMLLLELCGVSEEAIIADYAATEIYMKDLFASQKAQMEALGMHVPDYLLQAKPQDMARTLQHLHRRYRSAAGYLAEIGLSSEEIQALQRKLIGE